MAAAFAAGRAALASLARMACSLTLTGRISLTLVELGIQASGLAF
jgi:hypothetical protein